MAPKFSTVVKNQLLDSLFEEYIIKIAYQHLEYLLNKIHSICIEDMLTLPEMAGFFI